MGQATSAGIPVVDEKNKTKEEHMEGQKSLFPKAEQVLGPLDTYTTSLTERVFSAEETIIRKKSEIVFLKDELARTAKAIRIVRDELMGGSDAKIVPAGVQGILPAGEKEAPKAKEAKPVAPPAKKKTLREKAEDLAKVKTAKSKVDRTERLKKSAHEQVKKVAGGRTDLGMAAAAAED